MPRLIDRVRAALGALGVAATPGPTASGTGVPDMLGSLGAALLSAQRATSSVEKQLREIGLQYGRSDLETYVLPTLVLVESGTGEAARTSLYPSGKTLRLDQAGALETLIATQVHRTAPPEQVVAEVERIRRMPARFGPWTAIAGHTVLTLGFGMVLNPTLAALPVYVLLGALVGTIVVFASRAATLALLLPILTSFAITSLAILVASPLTGEDPIRLVTPALVSFLPGYTLTLAAIELTSSQVVAGASRMVYGIAQLGLLAFGVFAAVTVFGSPTIAHPPQALGDWAPWVGLALTSLGYYLFSVAPRGALPWIFYTLVVAYAAQLVGNVVLGAELSGFLGAVVVAPAVALARRLPAAPPSAVMVTCAYWLLVPGALGFLGVAEVATGADGASDAIVSTFVSLLAIAIGMVVGAGLTRDIGAVTRAWRRPPTPPG